MIYTVTLNPALDRILQTPGFAMGGTNRVQEEHFRAGGKGVNVARSLKDLGMDCTALCLIGGETGKSLMELLRAEGIPGEFISTAAQTRVNLKVFDGESGITTELNMPGEAPGEEDIVRLGQRLNSLIKPGDTVAFAGSLPKGAPEGLYCEWIERCRSRGASTVLDSSGEALRLGVAAKPALIKPNLSEMEYLCASRLDSMVDMFMASRKLVRDGVGMVVLSLGERGALLTSADKQIYGRPPKIRPACTVGAGDAMLGALLYGRSKGLPSEELLRLALALSAASAAGLDGAAFDRVQAAELLNQVEIDAL